MQETKSLCLNKWQKNTLSRTLTRVFFQDDNTRESWIHTLPQSHQICSCRRNNLLWKTPRNWLSYSYASGKQEQAHSRVGRRGRDTILPYTQLPAWQHTVGSKLKTWSFSLRSKEFNPHWVPQLLKPAPERGASKTSRAEKQRGPRDPQGYSGLRNGPHRTHTWTHRPRDPGRSGQSRGAWK